MVDYGAGVLIKEIKDLQNGCLKIHNAGVGGSSPPIATNKINGL